MVAGVLPYLRIWGYRVAGDWPPAGLTKVYCNKCGRRLTPTENVCQACGAPSDPLAKDSPTLPVPPVPKGVSELTADELADLVAERRSQVGILVVTRGSTAGSQFELTGPRTTLGRDPKSDVFLDDVTVSRHHAEIRTVGPAHVVADSGSVNGTYLNGERVEEVMLEDLDEIQIGRFRLIFFGPRFG